MKIEDINMDRNGGGCNHLSNNFPTSK
jgi:hypothetical protein